MDKFLEYDDSAARAHLKIALARRVCENLVRGKKYSRLDKFCISDMDVVFVIGRRHRKIHVFLPWLSTHDMNMYEVGRMKGYIAKLYRGSVFHIALCDLDSSVLYYSLTPGYVDKPECVQ